MKEQNFKQPDININKSMYPNKQNHSNQIALDTLKTKIRSLSIKNEDSQNFYIQNNQKLLGTKNIKIVQDSANYKTETFNSHNPLKPKHIIINEKNNLSEMPISKEKKIYLYLKNNGKNEIHSDTNSIFETPKNIIQKPEEFVEKLNLDEQNKEELEKNFNRTSIINNINNNNVNNIFVNFISSNIHNDLSRNLNKEKNNNYFNNNANNSILEDGLNQNDDLTKVNKDSKLIILKDEKSQSKLNVNKEISNKEDRLNYFAKIMNTANSFIFNRNNYPFYKMKPQKTDPKMMKKYKNKNKSINTEENKLKHEKKRKNKKSLKDYLLKKNKKIKKNLVSQNLKKHNNSSNKIKMQATIFNYKFTKRTGNIFIF